MELAGKYSASPSSFKDVINLAAQYLQQEPRKMANGDRESEMIARIIPAAMTLGYDPIQAVDQYTKQK